MDTNNYYKNKIWKCHNCGKEFKDRHASSTRTPKFCSRNCAAKILSKVMTPKRLKAFELGRISRPSPRKGKHLSESHRLNISKGKKGLSFLENHKNNLSLSKIGKFTEENNPNWRGDDVGYGALHEWVYKILGTPKKCEKCGLKIDDNRKIHWANKSGKYKRNKKDWIRLCVKCHKKYDLARIK